jgi:L-seryl-tRNA(Ser) seleniumtransferase
MRLVPKVDQVLRHPALSAQAQAWAPEVVLRVVQDEVERLRAALRDGSDAAPASGRAGSVSRSAPALAVLPEDRASAETAVAAAAAERLAGLAAASLRRVLNCTGVVLHTNLGRAPLSPAALAAVAHAGAGYVDLEYDLGRGTRASRMDHVAPLVAALFGAEAACVVNNNAAAVLLAVDTLGQAGVVVSRGELVEIGDGFRLPDILARARVPIHEIGTTNRTTAADYEAAAARPGCVLLKVHRSNFAMHGFTHEAGIEELVAVARRRGATVVYDLGAGALVRFDGLGSEPDARAALAKGCDLVTMSGDKLIGGPQAGLVAGREAAVAALRRNPWMRALRIDKLTLAALQATLVSYATSSRAQQEVPTLRRILTPPAELEARARRLLNRLRRGGDVELELAPGTASVGGGAFADVELPSFEVRLRLGGVRGPALAARLRAGEPAVVCRVKDDWVGLDVRCVEDGDLEALAVAVEAAMVPRGEGRT